MGLNTALMSVLFLLLGACAPKVAVNPADRVSKQMFYYDCCNPSLHPDDKDMCRMAAKDEDRILWDTKGNKYTYIWSDCKIGGEPWRKWE